MLSVRNLKDHSISRGVTVCLILTIVVVSTITISINYVKASREAREQLENKADEYKTFLTNILEMPLWIFEEETVKDIGTFYARNELVAKLKIIDSLGGVVFDIDKEDDALLVSRTGEVLHNGKSAGHVEISLTSRHYEEINRQLLWSGIITILINVFFVIIVTGFLLRMFLKIRIR